MLPRLYWEENYIRNHHIDNRNYLADCGRRQSPCVLLKPVPLVNRFLNHALQKLRGVRSSWPLWRATLSFLHWQSPRIDGFSLVATWNTAADTTKQNMLVFSRGQFRKLILGLVPDDSANLILARGGRRNQHWHQKREESRSEIKKKCGASCIIETQVGSLPGSLREAGYLDCEHWWRRCGLETRGWPGNPWWPRAIPENQVKPNTKAGERERQPSTCAHKWVNFALWSALPTRVRESSLAARHPQKTYFAYERAQRPSLDLYFFCKLIFAFFLTTIETLMGDSIDSLS